MPPRRSSRLTAVQIEPKTTGLPRSALANKDDGENKTRRKRIERKEECHEETSDEELKSGSASTREEYRRRREKKRRISQKFWMTIDLRTIVFNQLDHNELAVMMRLERSAMASVSAVLYRRIGRGLAAQLTNDTVSPIQTVLARLINHYFEPKLIISSLDIASTAILYEC